MAVGKYETTLDGLGRLVYALPKEGEKP